MPEHFIGIPILDNRNSFFYEPDKIWSLFVHTIDSANNNAYTKEFKQGFESATAAKGNGLSHVTMALFWIRPNFFMPLDANTRVFILAQYGLEVPGAGCTGAECVKFVEDLQVEREPNITFTEIFSSAWQWVRERRKGVGNGFEEEISTSDQYIMNKSELDKNIILYGSPGTGKTYSTIQYAVAIVEEKLLERITGRRLCRCIPTLFRI